MKAHSFILFLIVNVYYIKCDSELKDTLDKIIASFRGPLQSTYELRYNGYMMNINRIKFFKPVISKMEITETTNTIEAKNIIMTMIYIFYIQIDDAPSSLFFKDVISQFNISSLKLQLLQSGKIILSELVINNHTIDKYWDFMTSSYYKEFQEDINKENWINILEGVVSKVIENIIKVSNK